MIKQFFRSTFFLYICLFAFMSAITWPQEKWLIIPGVFAFFWVTYVTCSRDIKEIVKRAKWPRNSMLLNINVYDLETAKEEAVWGTYGKGGDQPLKYVRLSDCQTDHLVAILDSQESRTEPDYVLIIKAILADRGVVR